MNRHTGIIVGVIVLALVAGGVVYMKNARTTTAPASIPIVPATSTKSLVSIPTTSSYYVPKYTEDGNIDTSDWITLVGTTSGFSLKAPKERSYMGWGPRTTGTDHFSFTLDEEGLGMYVIAIVKNTGSNLSNWVEQYVVTHPEKIINQKMTTVGKYPALEFMATKRDEPKIEDTGAVMEYSFYPEKNNQTKRLLPYVFFENRKHLVVDGGDRYLVVGVDVTPDKLYTDTLNTILTSLEISPPKPLE